MSESKVRLKIELEGEGEIVAALADALRQFVGTLPQFSRPENFPPRRRFEDIPPAVSISPRRNGRHD